LANFHEDGVFSDKNVNGVGNIAGRTIMHTILTALERIAFNGDPLQFLLIETTYQPFISLFHQTGATDERSELKGIPNYNAAIVIELRRGSPPDLRDFLRIKFKNGTAEGFKDIHVFGHRSDIPLTEFIYRAEGSAITSNKQWKDVCGGRSVTLGIFTSPFNDPTQAAFSGAFAFVGLLALFMAAKFVKRSRERARESRLRLPGDENFRVDIPVVEKTRLI
jgi:lysosomal acid phosphatase